MVKCNRDMWDLQDGYYSMPDNTHPGKVYYDLICRHPVFGHF